MPLFNIIFMKFFIIFICELNSIASFTSFVLSFKTPLFIILFIPYFLLKSSVSLSSLLILFKLMTNFSQNRENNCMVESPKSYMYSFTIPFKNSLNSSSFPAKFSFTLKKLITFSA